MSKTKQQAVKIKKKTVSPSLLDLIEAALRRKADNFTLASIIHTVRGATCVKLGIL